MPAFALATLTFAVIPGPALIYTAAQTLARGWRAGLWAAAGIHLGCWAHVAAAALGLSAAFRHAPDLYAALKLAGAAYLVWLGLRMAFGREAAEAAHPERAPARSARRAFLDSVVVELLNPKVALFFIAFLSQFVDPTAGLPAATQFLILGAIVNVSFSTADVTTVFAAGAAMGRARRSCRSVVWARGLGGTILVGLGARMALARG